VKIPTLSPPADPATQADLAPPLSAPRNSSRSLPEPNCGTNLEKGAGGPCNEGTWWNIYFGRVAWLGIEQASAASRRVYFRSRCLKMPAILPINGSARATDERSKPCSLTLLLDVVLPSPVKIAIIRLGKSALSFK
jgi:hypothetical protein